jgi:hypothetical protein
MQTVQLSNSLLHTIKNLLAEVIVVSASASHYIFLSTYKLSNKAMHYHAQLKSTSYTIIIST